MDILLRKRSRRRSVLKCRKVSACAVRSGLASKVLDKDFKFWSVFLGALANCNHDWVVMLVRINPNRSGVCQGVISYGNDRIKSCNAQSANGPAGIYNMCLE